MSLRSIVSKLTICISTENKMNKGWNNVQVEMSPHMNIRKLYKLILQPSSLIFLKGFPLTPNCFASSQPSNPHSHLYTSSQLYSNAHFHLNSHLIILPFFYECTPCFLLYFFNFNFLFYFHPERERDCICLFTMQMIGKER